MCYPASVNFIKFLMDCCISDDILDTIQITDRKLLYVKLSKSGQILRVGKTCFPRPSHIYLISLVTIELHEHQQVVLASCFWYSLDNNTLVANAFYNIM